MLFRPKAWAAHTVDTKNFLEKFRKKANAMYNDCSVSGLLVKTADFVA